MVAGDDSAVGRRRGEFVNTGLMFSKASDEWETPQAFFEMYDEEFLFGLDAAATEANSKCTAFFTQADDALTRDWYPGQGFSVWLNPPYSQCRAFIAKAAEEAAKGCTVVCLVPSRTDTRWWFAHVVNGNGIGWRPGVDVQFIKGRLKFGNSNNSAPFPSVVVIFRPVLL